MTITEIHVDSDLLPQVIRELLEYTTNPNDVQVTDGPSGKMLLVESGVAHRWYEYNPWRQEPAPPIERSTRRKVTSATPSKELL